MSYKRKTKRDPEFVKNQEKFKNEVIESIESNLGKRDDELEEFLRAVLPKTDYNYYLFIKSKGGIPVNIRYDYESYLRAVIAITDFKVETYYFPVAFTGWRDNKGTLNHFRCIYVDIDHTDINPLNMSKEEIRQYLKASYGVPDGLLPQYCVASSSGGLHCVWLTEDIFDAEVRDSIARKMITFFGGDHNAFPKSHPYRVAKSYNCKREVPTKSKLIKLCENDRYTASELGFFDRSEDEIEEYFRKEKAKTSEKRLKTLAENKKNKAEPSTDTFTDQAKKSTYKRCKDMSDYAVTPNTNVKRYTNFRPQSRYKNLLGDLNNYYVNRGGQINGYRHTFIFLIANYARIFMIKSDCIDLCLQYVTEEFEEEMYSIIDSVYDSDYTYYYNFSTIGKLLDFSQFDISSSYCSFSEEIKKERKKKRNKDYYQRNKDRNITEAARTRESNRCIIELLIDRPVKEIAQYCKLSVSSIYRIRKEILAEQSK